MVNIKIGYTVFLGEWQLVSAHFNDPKVSPLGCIKLQNIQTKEETQLQVDLNKNAILDSLDDINLARDPQKYNVDLSLKEEYAASINLIIAAIGEELIDYYS